MPHLGAMPPNSPTVRHRQLGTLLRKLREGAGLSNEQAVAALSWSRAKLARFEAANRIPSQSDVGLLLDLYGAPETYRTALLQLVRDARKRGWWTSYADVLPASYAELEDDAIEIRSWQVQVIPGLLQIDDYALALIRLSNPDDSEEAQLRRLQARMARRTVLTRQTAPVLRVVMDEAALRRPIGGQEVMRRQLQALQEMGRRPNVHIQVAPTSAGDVPGLEGSFSVLSFEGPISLDVAYLEGVGGGVYMEDAEQVRRCNVKYEAISDKALSESESEALIGTISEE